MDHALGVTNLCQGIELITDDDYADRAALARFEMALVSRHTSVGAVVCR